jgi:hypothetical protein
LAGTSEGFEPTAVNWRALDGYREDDPQVNQWTAPMFAAYFWYLVSWVRGKRHDRPVSLTIPDWRPLIDTMTYLLEQFTKQQLRYRLWTICQHWSAVLELIGPDSEAHFQLDEYALSSPVIVDALDKLIERGEGFIKDIHDQREQRLAQPGRC